jgi:hypothetical protein
MPTALPIKDHTIGVYFIYFGYELFVCVIGEFFVKCVVDRVDGVGRALVNQDLGALFGLLLDGGEQRIIRTVFGEGHNHSDSFFLSVVGFDVQASDAFVTFFLATVGRIL